MAVSSEEWMDKVPSAVRAVYTASFVQNRVMGVSYDSSTQRVTILIRVRVGNLVRHLWRFEATYDCWRLYDEEAVP